MVILEACHQGDGGARGRQGNAPGNSTTDDNLDSACIPPVKPGFIGVFYWQIAL